MSELDNVNGNLIDNAAPTPSGWHIQKNVKPIPDRRFDWDFWHDEFDGADGGNGLCGTAASWNDAVEQCWEIENERLCN